MVGLPWAVRQRRSSPCSDPAATPHLFSKPDLPTTPIGVPCELSHEEVSMHPGSPDAWRVIWVVAAGFFLLAERVRRLRLWFLPFAVGAGVAAGTAFAGVALPWEWVAFVGSSAITLAALRPLGRRLAWQ